MKTIVVKNIDDKTYEALEEIQRIIKKTMNVDATIEDLACDILNVKTKLVLARMKVNEEARKHLTRKK